MGIIYILEALGFRGFGAIILHNFGVQANAPECHELLHLR